MQATLNISNKLQFSIEWEEYSYYKSCLIDRFQFFLFSYSLLICLINILLFVL